MCLEDIIHVVPRLNAVERQQLRDYLDQLPGKSPRLSPEERMKRLNAAFDAMGEGLSPAELEDMTAAMTGESSNPAENNWIFRARKYPPDHPGCADKELTPGRFLSE